MCLFLEYALRVVLKSLNGPTASQYCLPAFILARDPHIFYPGGNRQPVKLLLRSGHAEEKSLAIHRDLARADVAKESQETTRVFPIR